MELYTARSTLGHDALAFIVAVVKKEKPKSHLEATLVSLTRDETWSNLVVSACDAGGHQRLAADHGNKRLTLSWMNELKRDAARFAIDVEIGIER